MRIIHSCGVAQIVQQLHEDSALLNKPCELSQAPDPLDVDQYYGTSLSPEQILAEIWA